MAHTFITGRVDEARKRRRQNKVRSKEEALMVDRYTTPQSAYLKGFKDGVKKYKSSVEFLSAINDSQLRAAYLIGVDDGKLAFTDAIAVSKSILSRIKSHE